MPVVLTGPARGTAGAAGLVPLAAAHAVLALVALAGA